MRDLYEIISPDKCYIHLNCNPSIIKDLKFLNPERPVSFYDHTTIQTDDVEDIYIATWVGRFFRDVGSQYGASLTSNYLGFKQIYEQLGIEQHLKPIEHYLPSVDYNFVDKTNVDLFFSNINTKCVFISNGDVWSGQSENFNFNEIINCLPENVVYILSHDMGLRKPNVFYTSDIIKIKGSDLLEISYLSTKCNVIVGRASGPVCFAHVKDNYKDKNKVLIAISNTEYEGNWHHLVKDGAKQVWTNNYNSQNIVNIIKQHI
jgi:hypothetical protein